MEERRSCFTCRHSVPLYKWGKYTLDRHVIDCQKLLVVLLERDICDAWESHDTIRGGDNNE